MIATLISLAIALVLIWLLVFLLRRSESTLSSDAFSPGPDDELSNASQAFEERSEELMDRIFGSDDWDFVLRRAPKRVQRLFLNERKELAFCWLSHIRTRAKAAMRIHVAHAGKSDKLQPLSELRLTIDYLMILARCEFVAAILWLRGPMAMRRMIKQLTGLSVQFRGWLELASKAVPR